jgi:hypothetical protein
MTSTPVIFVAGPSGVGKSQVSQWLEADLGLLHLDIDRYHGFGVNGLRQQWDQFGRLIDYAPLMSALCDRIVKAKRSGIVLSFPSTRILTPEQIDFARSAGICTVVLWGTEELCKEARRARDSAQGRTFNEKRYDRSNRDAFDWYGRSEYAGVRVEAFCPDGSRVPREQIVSTIQRNPFVTNESLVLFDDGEQIIVSTEDEPARFLLISGKPIGEPVAWYGPIVMNTQEELEIAFEEYGNGTFIKHKQA